MASNIFLKSNGFLDSDTESQSRPVWLSVMDKDVVQKGGNYDLNRIANSIDSEMPNADSMTSTTELEDKLRSLFVSSDQVGGKKSSRKSSKKVKKSSKKRSRKSSRKSSRGGARKSSKKGSKKRSRKGSKKGSRKGSKKMRGGSITGKRPLNQHGGDDEEMDNDIQEEVKMEESSEEHMKEEKPEKEKSKSKRELPPALVKRQKVQKHIGDAVKSAGMKYNVGKIAKVVSSVVEDSGAGSGAEMDSAKAIKYFDENKEKYMKNL